MVETVFWLLLTLFVFRGVTRDSSATIATLATDAGEDAASDFAMFREAVADQNSRLDALDSSLGALSALLFAILSYLPEHRAGATHALEPHVLIGATICIAVAIGLSLFAAIAFRGSEGPSLDAMLQGLDSDRAGTFRENTKSLARDYFRNSRLIGRKLLILRVAVVAGAAGTLVISVAPVVH
jgi:hypothetical protein